MWCALFILVAILVPQRAAAATCEERARAWLAGCPEAAEHCIEPFLCPPGAVLFHSGCDPEIARRHESTLADARARVGLLALFGATLALRLLLCGFGFFHENGQGALWIATALDPGGDASHYGPGVETCVAFEASHELEPVATAELPARCLDCDYLAAPVVVGVYHVQNVR